MTKTIENNIEFIKRIREFIISKIKYLSIEELNYIHSPFNNNIIWNLGHMNAVFHELIHLNSGVRIPISEDIVKPFLPNTRPNMFYNESFVYEIQQNFIKSPSLLLEHYLKGELFQFETPMKIKEVYNINLKSIEDFLLYILHHDSIHYANILILTKKNI